MGWELPSYFLQPCNVTVTRFLEITSPSAHSDIVGELLLSAAGLPGAGSYCPDHQNYAYVVLHTVDNKIFALAYGIKRLCYRVPSGFSAAVEAHGGKAWAEIGPEWVCFDLFDTGERTEVSRQRMVKWCRIAFESS